MKIYSNGKMLEVSGGGGGQAQDIYDDQERVIGSWFGKPLYRKTITGTLPSKSGTWTVVSEAIPNAIIRSMNAVVYLSSMEKPVAVYSLPIIASGGYAYVSYNTTFQPSELKGLIGYVTYSAFFGKPLTVVLEYTKTTDQATFELPADERAAVPDVPMMGVSVSGDIAQAPDILDLVEEV